MPRYIDADALLKKLPDDLPYKGSVKRVIMQAPTADVEEVRNGEWVKSENEDYDDYEHHYCSVCNAVALFSYQTEPMYDEDYDGDMKFVCEIDVGILEDLTAYCPNCGAKMRD